MLNGGYCGKLLRVDLMDKSFKIENLHEEEIRPYIGASGYAVKLLWDELSGLDDPLDATNKIIFATGPIAGTLTPSGGSYSLCFKAPLTGAWCQSRSGGSFGPKLKYAGYDFVIIEGKSSEPTYLWIDDGEIKFMNASTIWGKGVEESTTAIQDEIGDLDSSVALIGPAGENLVRYAAVINDRGRAAGRGGGGAIMGSKNLKAVVVSGKGAIKVADPKRFTEAIVQAEENLQRYPFEGVNQFGTPLLVGIQNAAGALPTKNFTYGQYERADAIGGEKLTEENLIKRRACYGCSMGCGRYTVVEDGKYKIRPQEGPEYETLASFGSLCENDNLESILKANYLCNDLGLDTISAGVAVAFAMECYEHDMLDGYIERGRDLRWGNTDEILALIEDIAYRKGLGNILAEGVKLAAETIGEGSEEFALHVKGMELPMHEPRGESKVMALQYAVNPRGACHMHPNWAAIWDSGKFECGMNKLGQPWPPTDNMLEVGAQKGLAYKYIAMQGEISEIIGACIFHSWGADNECITPSLYAEILASLVGWDITPEELFLAAERSWNMKRCFNIREGLTRKDDLIPKRLKQPIHKGPCDGQSVLNIDTMIDEYFDAIGWDKETGIPYPETLERLGIGWVYEELQ